MGKKLLSYLSILLVLCTLVTFTQYTPVQAASSMKIVSSTKHYCAPNNGIAGTTAQFKVQGAGSKKVTWKSSNSKVATVSKSGVVAVKKTGSTTITAKVGTKTLKRTVRVTDKHDFDNGYCVACGVNAPSWMNTRAGTQKQLEDLVFSIVTPDMSDEEKVAAINDWLWVQPYETRECLEYKYDKHGQRIPKYCDACDGLAAWNGMGDCEEQAQAFFIMAYAAGLEVRLYHGGNHEWTTVKVDGLWYVYDPTRSWVSTELTANPYGRHWILTPIEVAYTSKDYSGMSREAREEIIILYRANYLTRDQYEDLYYDKNPKYPYLTKSN